MSNVSILKKSVMQQAKYMNLTKFYIGRGSCLGNEWSHLPNSQAKHKVANVNQAVVAHRHWFLGMLADYKNPEYREIMVYIRKMYDEMMAGKDIAVVCYCLIKHGDEPLQGHGCHGEIISELLEVLRDHYASNGFTYCVEHLRARYYGTQPSMRDAIINDMRTGRM